MVMNVRVVILVLVLMLTGCSRYMDPGFKTKCEGPRIAANLNGETVVAKQSVWHGPKCTMGGDVGIPLLRVCHPVGNLRYVDQNFFLYRALPKRYKWNG